MDTLNGYRFSFNGKEKTDEIYGDGNGVDYGARICNARLGRWMSTEPLFAKYPSQSPYGFCSNSPLVQIDIDGEDIVVTTIPASETTKKTILITVNAKL